VIQVYIQIILYFTVPEDYWLLIMICTPTVKHLPVRGDGEPSVAVSVAREHTRPHQGDLMASDEPLPRQRDPQGVTQLHVGVIHLQRDTHDREMRWRRRRRRREKHVQGRRCRGGGAGEVQHLTSRVVLQGEGLGGVLKE